MPLVPLIDEHEGTADVRAVFDNIRKTRNTDWINKFWNARQTNPVKLRVSGQPE